MVAPGSYLVKKSRIGHDGQSSEVAGILIRNHDFAMHTCAIEAQRVNLSARVFDKGTLVNSIVGYPLRMEFFSTPELIEIGGYPFPVQGYKPTREEAIE